jgi:hypothetical protein
MSRIGALARKDLRDILREKTIVVALVVQLFIAGFSTFLAVGLTGLYDPASTSARTAAEVAYVGPGGFDSLLRQERNLHVQALDPDGAVAQFHLNRVDAVVEESVGKDGLHSVSLLLEDGGIPATLLLTQMKGLLERYEEQLRTADQARLEQKVLTVPAPQKAQAPYAFVYATLLPLLVFTPVFLSGAVAGDSVSQEVQTGTLKLLRSAPLGTGRILAGKLLVPLLLAPAQLLLWIGLLALNHLPVDDVPGLLGLSLATTLVLAGTGVALAAGLGRSSAVQAAYAMVAILLALGSLLLPTNPLNLAALLATGAADGRAWATLGLLAALGVLTTAAGMAWAGRRLRKERA